MITAALLIPTALITAMITALITALIIAGILAIWFGLHFAGIAAKAAGRM